MKRQWPSSARGLWAWPLVKSFAAGGHQVTLYDPNEETLRTVQARAGDLFRLLEQDERAGMARLSTEHDLCALALCASRESDGGETWGAMWTPSPDNGVRFTPFRGTGLRPTPASYAWWRFWTPSRNSGFPREREVTQDCLSCAVTLQSGVLSAALAKRSVQRSHQLPKG
jgi:hypothetical protein